MIICFAEKLGLEITNNSDASEETNCIRIWINSTLGENAGLYHLFTDIEDDTLTVIGQSLVAVYYGIQSLLSLVSGSPNQGSVPDVSIKDEPRFEHRGMHVDLSRNFRTKADILRLMEAMSMYKMNKLHLHLSDDEGWRLEIPGIPELTEVIKRMFFLCVVFSTHILHKSPITSERLQILTWRGDLISLM